MRNYRDRLVGPTCCQVGPLLGHDGDECRANKLADDGITGEGILCHVCGRVYPRFSPELIGVFRHIIEADTHPGFPQAPEVTIGATNMLDSDHRRDLQVKDFARAYPDNNLESLVRTVFSYRPYGFEAVEVYYLARGGPEADTDDNTIGADYREQNWRGVPENLMTVATALSAIDYRCVNQPGVTERICLRRGAPGRDDVLVPRIKVELVAQGESPMELV